MRCNPSFDLAPLGHPSSARSASFLHPQRRRVIQLTPRAAAKEKARSGFPGRALIFQPKAGAVLTAARRAGLRSRQQAFALGALASQLASAANGFSLLASALFRGLLEVHVALHFTEAAFTLHLLLQGFQRLIDIVVANENLNQVKLSFGRPPRPVRETGEQNKILFRRPSRRMKAR